MTRRSLFTILSLTAVLMLLIAACGDDDEEEATATSPSAGGAPTATPGAGGGTEEEGGGEDPLVAQGMELYNSEGCSGCHSVDGSQGVGPTWQGLYGEEVTLDDGSTVTADDAYITESIRDPGAKVVEGFQPGLMPTSYSNWTDDQVNAIIAYIKSLS